MELNWYGVPPYVVRLKADELQTITVTFSSPPELLYIGTGRDKQPFDWSLDGRTLTMSVLCYDIAGSDHILEYPIRVHWVGGGAVFRMWCPTTTSQ